MGRHLTDAQRAAIRRALKSGATYSDIAARHHVSTDTVQNIAADIGHRRIRYLDADDEARIVELAAAGRSVADIADLLGVAEGTVRRVETAHGVERANPRPRLDAAQLARIDHLIAAGETNAAIAREIGCAPTTVMRRRHRRRDARLGRCRRRVAAARIREAATV